MTSGHSPGREFERPVPPRPGRARSRRAFRRHRRHRVRRACRHRRVRRFQRSTGGTDDLRRAMPRMLGERRQRRQRGDQARARISRAATSLDRRSAVPARTADACRSAIRAPASRKASPMPHVRPAGAAAQRHELDRFGRVTDFCRAAFQAIAADVSARPAPEPGRLARTSPGESDREACRAACSQAACRRESSAGMPKRSSSAETRRASSRSPVTSAAFLPGSLTACRSAMAIAAASSRSLGASTSVTPDSARVMSPSGIVAGGRPIRR